MDIPADWYPQTLNFVISNFCISMLLVAGFFMLLHRVVTRGRVAEPEIVYRWLVVFVLGFTGFYNFTLEVFYPIKVATMLGWQLSPFQFLVGIANLAIGMVGLLSFKASYGFRLAVVVVATFWLWGAAAGHINQIIVNQNYTMANVGTCFWSDLFVPLFLIMCIRRLKTA